ncbi:unnamed protein product [Aphanomyces euteiches]
MKTVHKSIQALDHSAGSVVVPGRLLVGLLQVEKSNEPQNPPNDLNKALNKVLKNHLKKTHKKFFKNMNN